MKIGRNDPCPCGSGKKYKKCCLAKDEAAARSAYTQRAAAQRVVAQPFDLPPLPEPPPPPPPDPLDQARNALWEEFEAVEGAELPALFQRALAEPDLLDAELAFEMICKIRDSGDQVGFVDVLDMLREQRPDLYQHDASYYLDWQIADAIRTGNLPSLPDLGAALADAAGKDLDTFYATIDRLAYHGQLALVAQMMARAYPHVRTSGKLVPWAADEFARRAMDLTFLAYVEQSQNLTPDDPDLLAALELFGPVDPERIALHIALLTDQDERPRTLGDFDFRQRARRERDDEEQQVDPAAQQLQDMTFVFLGEVHRTQGMSLAKGDLARKAIMRYILARHAGELEPVDSPLERLRRPKDRKTPSVVRRAPANPLCPDRATLDRFLAGMLNFISARDYEAAATLELTPAWLRFLEARSLLTAEQREAASQELRQLVADATPIWDQRTSDPTVGSNIRLAWEHA